MKIETSNNGVRHPAGIRPRNNSKHQECVAGLEAISLRINADDFGISPGVNQAIEKMFQRGALDSASLITGCNYFDDAIAIAKKNPQLKVGLHFNLCSGQSLSTVSNSILTDNNGKFKNGFLKILLLSIFKKKEFLNAAQKELDAQINLLKKSGITVNHIDSHRHTHMIPALFKIVAKTAKKNQIKKIRIINENLLSTFLINYPKTFLFDGGIIKWALLSFFRIISSNQKGLEPSYFFSILYTCKISKELIAKIKIPKKYSNAELEIMIHPGNPEIDHKLENLEERTHLISPSRNLENLST